MRVEAEEGYVETTTCDISGAIYVRIPIQIARLLGIDWRTRFRLHLARVDGKMALLLVKVDERKRS